MMVEEEEVMFKEEPPPEAKTAPEIFTIPATTHLIVPEKEIEPPEVTSTEE
jgi:hypothetical protein